MGTNPTLERMMHGRRGQRVGLISENPPGLGKGWTIRSDVRSGSSTAPRQTGARNTHSLPINRVRAYGYIAARDSASGEREIHPEQAEVAQEGPRRADARRVCETVGREDHYNFGKTLNRTATQGGDVVLLEPRES